MSLGRVIMPFMIKGYFLGIMLLAAVLAASHLHAAELLPDIQEIWKARVEAIHSTQRQPIPGTDTMQDIQSIEVRILEGRKEGQLVAVDNDYLKLGVGDVFYLNYTRQSDGIEYYAVGEPYRLPWLLGLLALFVAVVVFFGGIQGIRGLISLIGSLLLIMYVLLPQILAGVSPI
ncbi:MAG TPA: hypothetical protein VEB60_01570, partial [Candidatus Paceibacterota bacterium]|nr:hypothetical protein [Candidatus Paceibacterota bacterium]